MPTASQTVGDAINNLSNKAKGWWSAPYHGNSSPGLIAHYWLAAGGSAAHVNEAVAAALAESGGNAGAISGANSNGTRDIGYWQVNSVHGPAMATTDPLTNARAAVHLSKNGTDWSPWCTSYSDGICHGSTSDPRYKGAGRGNRMGGGAVLDAATLGYVYARDAMAGAIYGARSAGGAVVDDTTPFQAVKGAVGATLDPAGTLGDIGKAAAGAISDPFSGTVGKILAYAGYGLLAAFGATLITIGLAVLVLALVDRQPNLAAITPAGRLAGAASEARAGASARAARNQGKGADAFRQTKAGRVAHGESTSTAKGTRTPTHGGQRVARRSHPGAGRMDDMPARRRRGNTGAGGPTITDRIRASHRGVSREASGAPF